MDPLQALLDGAARLDVGGRGPAHRPLTTPDRAAPSSTMRQKAALALTMRPSGPSIGDAERRRLEEARKARAAFIALELGCALAGKVDDGDASAPCRSEPCAPGGARA